MREQAHPFPPAAVAPDAEGLERGNTGPEGREERARMLVAGDLSRHDEELQRSHRLEQESEGHGTAHEAEEGLHEEAAPFGRVVLPEKREERGQEGREQDEKREVIGKDHARHPDARSKTSSTRRICMIAATRRYVRPYSHVAEDRFHGSSENPTSAVARTRARNAAPRAWRPSRKCPRPGTAAEASTRRASSPPGRFTSGERTRRRASPA